MPSKRNSNGPPPSNAWDTLDACTASERAFVMELLRGETPEDAAASVGWTSAKTVLDVLGRVQVRGAIQALAPMLATDPAGEAIARRLLRPYALARTAGLLDVPGQNGLAAARDLLDGSPGKGDGDALRRAWESRATRRGSTASGASDNGQYGNSPPGQGKPSA